jgi:hypothetical protein
MLSIKTRKWAKNKETAKIDETAPKRKKNICIEVLFTFMHKTSRLLLLLLLLLFTSSTWLLDAVLKLELAGVYNLMNFDIKWMRPILHYTKYKKMYK